MQKGNIYLIGFMGTGKTSVGRLLGDLTGREFVDMDQLITERTGMTIAGIFEEKGESFFRKYESDLLREISEVYDDLIVGTGGGIVIDPGNSITMKTSGVTVLLLAQPETIEARLSEDTTRPLLNNRDRRNAILAILRDRNEKYLGAANVIVETDDKTVCEVAQDVLQQLGWKEGTNT